MYCFCCARVPVYLKQQSAPSDDLVLQCCSDKTQLWCFNVNNTNVMSILFQHIIARVQWDILLHWQLHCNTDLTPRLLSVQYDKFIMSMDRLSQHPYGNRCQEFIMMYREHLEVKTSSTVIPMVRERHAIHMKWDATT